MGGTLGYLPGAEEAMGRSTQGTAAEQIRSRLRQPFQISLPLPGWVPWGSPVPLDKEEIVPLVPCVRLSASQEVV